MSPAESRPERSALPTLPTGYYLENFKHILKNGLERYDDLLLPEERTFALTFLEMSQSAQMIYVRLVSRKGPWFRADKLNYPEISPLDGALAEAHLHGLLDSCAMASPDELLALLTVEELKVLGRACAERGILPLGNRALRGVSRREEILGVILGCSGNPFVRDSLASLFRAWCPRHNQCLRVFLLLFFGNLAQDMTEFVLQDLGIVNYESYSLGLAERLFTSRTHIEQRIFLSDVQESIREFLDQGLLDEACALADTVRFAQSGHPGVQSGSQLWHERVKHRCEKIYGLVGRALERTGLDEPALTYLTLTHEPPARERTARIHLKLGQVSRARSVVEEILKSPKGAQERDFAEGFLRKISKLEGLQVGPRAQADWPVRALTLERSSSYSIELQVVAYFEAQGYTAFFAENHLWRSLFGLAFWDIIFSAVPGAFNHPFQRAPADIHSPYFRVARAVAISERLTFLAGATHLEDFFLSVFDAKQGLANMFVHWSPEMRKQVSIAARFVEPGVLAAVLDRLSFDVGELASGFPDLFLCRPNAPGFELCEVKGPGDQLRPEQKSWLTFFLEHGVSVSVAKVSWLK